MTKINNQTHVYFSITRRFITSQLQVPHKGKWGQGEILQGGLVVNLFKRQPDPQIPLPNPRSQANKCLFPTQAKYYILILCRLWGRRFLRGKGIRCTFIYWMLKPQKALPTWIPDSGSQAFNFQEDEKILLCGIWHKREDLKILTWEVPQL